MGRKLDAHSVPRLRGSRRGSGFWYVDDRGLGLRVDNVELMFFFSFSFLVLVHQFLVPGFSVAPRSRDAWSVCGLGLGWKGGGGEEEGRGGGKG